MESIWSGRDLLDRMLSFGESAGEPENDRAKRRIMVGSWWFGALGIALDATFTYLDGFLILAAVGAAEVLAAFLPSRRYVDSDSLSRIVTAVLVVYTIANASETIMRGPFGIRTGSYVGHYRFPGSAHRHR